MTLPGSVVCVLLVQPEKCVKSSSKIENSKVNKSAFTCISTMNTCSGVSDVNRTFQNAYACLFKKRV